MEWLSESAQQQVQSLPDGNVVFLYNSDYASHPELTGTFTQVRVLVVCGNSGGCKSTAVELVCAELGIDIMEWVEDAWSGSDSLSSIVRPASNLQNPASSLSMASGLGGRSDRQTDIRLRLVDELFDSSSSGGPFGGRWSTKARKRCALCWCQLRHSALSTCGCAGGHLGAPCRAVQVSGADAAGQAESGQ